MSCGEKEKHESRVQSRLDHARKTREVLQKASSREHRRGKKEEAKQRPKLQQWEEIIDIHFCGKNIVCSHCYGKD